jgi:hypothetical protein
VKELFGLQQKHTLRIFISKKQYSLQPESVARKMLTTLRKQKLVNRHLAISR